MNVFEGVKILGYKVLNPRNVQFTISLTDYPSLTNPTLFKKGMKEMCDKYPGIDHWKAAAEEGLIYVEVVGSINMEAVFAYAEQVDE